jgi:hypothetical protein
MKELIATLKETIGRIYCLKTGWEYDNLSITQEAIIRAYCIQLFIHNGDEMKALEVLTEQIDSLTFKIKDNEK